VSKNRSLFNLEVQRLFLGSIAGQYQAARVKARPSMDIIQQAKFDRDEQHVKDLITDCDNFIAEEKGPDEIQDKSKN
jgi:hypothetical protein